MKAPAGIPEAEAVRRAVAEYLERQSASANSDVKTGTSSNTVLAFMGLGLAVLLAMVSRYCDPS